MLISSYCRQSHFCFIPWAVDNALARLPIFEDSYSIRQSTFSVHVLSNYLPKARVIL